MSAFAFFEWCENTAIGTGIRESVWIFPVVESFHLVALALLGGAALLVDLRLFGVLLPRVPVSQLARDARPWLLGSLAVMLISGFMLFVSEAVKCYYSSAFWVKMISLLLAIVFLFTIKQWAVTREEGTVAPAVYKTVGAVSLLLWFGVAAGGRWIGFS